MNALELLSSPAAYRLGWTLIHSLWEAAAVGVLAWVALTLLRRSSPQARYVAATAAMAAILVLTVSTALVVQAPAEKSPAPVAAMPLPATPYVGQPPANVGPFATVAPAPEPSPAVAAVAPAPAPVVSAEAWTARWQRAVEPWLPWLVAAWLAGVLALSFWRVGGWVAAYRLRVIGTQPAGPAIQSAARRLIGQLGIARPVRIMQSLVVQTPMVIGWLRPVILLPVGAVLGLTPDQLEAILAHELAHIRRFDYLVNLLQAVIEVVLFYHPAVWWIARRMRAERERCCDDVAVAVLGNPISYVEALAAVEVVRQPAAGAAVAASGSGGRDLVARVRRLLGLPDPACSSLAASAMATLLVFAVLAISITMGVSCGHGGLMSAEPAEESIAGPMAMTLPCGIKVELIGVAEKDPKTWGDDPAHAGTWWQPDGSPLAHTPAGKAVGGWTFAPGVPNLKSYKMLARVSWPQGVEKAVGGRDWPRWFIDPPMDNSWAYGVYDALRQTPPQEDLQLVGLSIPDSAKTATVSLSVASGPWHTVAAMSLPDRKMTVPAVGVEFTTLTEDPATHATTVGLYTLRVFERNPWRLVATDTAGREHVADEKSVSIRGGIRPTTIDLPLAQIKEIRFEARPVQTVVIENVSLEAGRRTEARATFVVQLPAPVVAGYRSVLLPNLDYRAATPVAVLNLVTGDLEPFPKDVADPAAINAHFRKEGQGALAYDGQLIALGGTRVDVDSKASPGVSLINNVLYSDVVVHLLPPAGTHLKIDMGGKYFEAVLGPETEAGLCLYYRPVGAAPATPAAEKARVEGAVMFGGKPRPGMKVELILSTGDPEKPERLTATTGTDGKFFFADVRPAAATLRPVIKLGSDPEFSLLALDVELNLKAGRTESVVLGGAGRPVTGRINLPQALVKEEKERVRGRYWLNAPGFFLDPDGTWPTGKQYGAFLASDMGAGYRGEDIPVNEDGSFQLDRVPSGKFTLQFALVRPGEDGTMVGIPFVVEPIYNGTSDMPVGLGTLELKTVQEEKAEVWGEAVQGVQARLLANKPQWQAEEYPSFAVEVRNQGTKPLRIWANQLMGWELEYDGQWYQPPKDVTFARLNSTGIDAGGWVPFAIHLNHPPSGGPNAWNRKADGTPLKLTPGRHKVRVAVWANEKDERQPGVGIRAASNLVEIDILPPRLVLAGSSTVLAEALKTPGRMVVACQAVGEALSTDDNIGRGTSQRQRFRIVEMIDGKTAHDEFVAEWRQISPESAMKDGMRVLWIAEPTDRLASSVGMDRDAKKPDMTPLWKGIKALEDRPDIRPEVVEAVESAATAAFVKKVSDAVTAVGGDTRGGSTYVNLSQARLDDATFHDLFKDLKQLPGLTILYLPANTHMTDACLKDVRELKGLEVLSCSGTAITDAGLKDLRDLKDLANLHLNRTQITDAGLKELLTQEKLNALGLGGTRVTDAGLRQLSALRRLDWLDLGDTQVTDASLKELKAIKKLAVLHVRGTHVTEAGVKDLQQTFPAIHVDGVGMPGAADNAIELSVRASKAAYGAGEPVELEIDFRNVSQADRLINLGVVLGAGQKHPLAVQFALVNRTTGAKWDLIERPFVVGGTMEEWLVPVAAGKTWTLKARLSDYVCMASSDLDLGKLAAGQYELTAAFEGKARQFAVAGAWAPDDPKLWTGRISSAPVQFSMAAPAAESKQSWIEIGGQVVDDKTGQPVLHYALQTGLYVDPKDPSKVGWGGVETTRSAWPEGKFSDKMGCLEGQKMWYRIVAAGYASQPITPEPLTAPATAKGLVVRMKRGNEIAGRVVDDAGKPVVGAAVYLGGDQNISFRDGEVESFRGSSVNTDSAGRFLIAGANDKSSLVIANGPAERPGPKNRTLVTLAAPPMPGEDIHLPAPGGLKITNDIDGAPSPARFHLELKTWDMPAWRSVGTVHLSPECAAGSSVTLPYLAPGEYDLAREATLTVGDAGGGYLCDRMTVTVEAGKTAEVSIVRKTGAPITGQVRGLEGTGAAGAMVFVRPEQTTGDPRAMGDEWKLPIFDVVASDAKGVFKTSRIAPGTYTVAAWAYKPETPEERSHLGFRLPALMGVIKVVVPATGEIKPVEIDLKPLPPAARP
jgi:beta-lactamase regulating signal transducer with metallopeptidase domain